MSPPVPSNLLTGSCFFFFFFLLDSWHFPFSAEICTRSWSILALLLEKDSIFVFVFVRWCKLSYGIDGYKSLFLELKQIQFQLWKISYPCNNIQNPKLRIWVVLGFQKNSYGTWLNGRCWRPWIQYYCWTSLIRWWWLQPGSILAAMCLIHLTPRLSELRACWINYTTLWRMMPHWVRRVTVLMGLVPHSFLVPFPWPSAVSLCFCTVESFISLFLTLKGASLVEMCWIIMNCTLLFGITRMNNRYTKGISVRATPPTTSGEFV